MTEDLRKLAAEIIRKTYGKRRSGKDTRWLNQKVQKSMQAKKVVNKDRDRDSTNKNLKCKNRKKMTNKKMLVTAKATANEHFYEDLDGGETKDSAEDGKNKEREFQRSEPD